MDYFGNQKCCSTHSSELNYPQHQCSIIYEEKFSLYGKKGEREQKQAEAWKRHLLRLQSLAAPKKRASKLITTMDVKRATISKLLPRLTVLAQPKYVCQKYVKRPDTPFELPGKIKDWKSHRNWLKIRAQPKRLGEAVLPVINESDEECIEKQN